MRTRNSLRGVPKEKNREIKKERGRERLMKKGEKNIRVGDPGRKKQGGSVKMERNRGASEIKKSSRERYDRVGSTV